MGSTRLPGKIMKQIAGRPLIDWVLESAGKITKVGRLIVATTTGDDDSPFIEYLERKAVPYYRGPSEDVLGRFYGSAKAFDADPVIRLCADSPLVAASLMDTMMDSHIKSGADLTYCPSPLPLGIVGEVISFKALETSCEVADKPHHREHVTPYFHENPGKFKVSAVKAPLRLHGCYRLTIDEKKDLEMFERLFNTLEQSGKNVDLDSALSLLKERPDIAGMASSVVQRNWRIE